MTLPRQIIPGSFWLITRRCAQRQFLMRPDPITNETFVYCLGEAAQRFGVDVILPFAGTNHHHTTIWDPHGTSVEFTQQFHKMFAKAQNVHRGRSENLWSSHPPSMVLLDPEEVIERLVYAATNPVKDGLVERVAQWPGVNGLWALLEGKPLVARRPAHFFRSDGPMPESVALDLVIPAELGPPEVLKRELRRRVAETEQRLAEERRTAGRRVIGRRGILRQDWRGCPETVEPRRRIRPRFAARDLLRRLELIRQHKAFQAAYRVALVAWRAGEAVVFPFGTYWLHRFANVEVAAPPKN